MIWSLKCGQKRGERNCDNPLRNDEIKKTLKQYATHFWHHESRMSFLSDLFFWKNSEKGKRNQNTMPQVNFSLFLHILSYFTMLTTRLFRAVYVSNSTQWGRNVKDIRDFVWRFTCGFEWKSSSSTFWIPMMNMECACGGGWGGITQKCE